MAKWFGVIGYGINEEVERGIWENKIVERNYYGDVIRNSRRLLTNGYTSNDDIRVSNRISIVSDPFATENFHSMLYAEYMGVKWKIEDVEVEYPRLILSLGVKYNE